MKKKQEGLLAGIRILDLADEQGSFCTKLLADLGARVVRIERPGGDPSRSLPLFQYCNLNKMGTTIDLQTPEGGIAFETLIRNADVLVESFAPGQLAALRLGFRRLQQINPRLIHLSISPFGRTGPKRPYHSCDSVMAAVAGQMHVSRAPAGKPLKMSGPQSFYTASLFGANAVLLGLRRRSITGHGRHIDLSIQEAVASTLDPVMIDDFRSGEDPGRPETDLRNDAFFPLPCKDGYIVIPLLRHWETILELVNAETPCEKRLGEEWRDAGYRNTHAHLFVNAAASWTVRHAKKELFHLGQAMGFPWAPVESPREVRKSPQLKARGFFVRTLSAGGRRSISVPGMPYKFTAFSPPPPKPAPRIGALIRQRSKIFASETIGHPTQCGNDVRGSSAGSGDILRGIRVLDFTRMLAGPYATRILGDFGAEVIKVQSRLTASGAESNDSSYFAVWNRNKRSIGLNLNHPEAKQILLEMVSVSDIVVQNFSPRVLANWGLGYPRLKSVKPDLIMASISALGQTGPWKNYVGFAETFHALSGLMCETSRSLDAPVPIGFAYGDVIAGLYAALSILASLEYRDRTGRGQHIDLSAYESLCTLPGSAFIGHVSEWGRRRQASADESLWGCYPCSAAGSWCVLAIRSEREWERFCDISKLPELKRAKFSAWATGKSRAGLDKQIARWTVHFTAEAVAARLQRAGIAAGAVQNSKDLSRDPRLAARNFFPYLLHPRLGMQFSNCSALWPWNEEPKHWKPAPALGEDNRCVFVDLLGHSESELYAMLDKGVLERA